MKTKTKKISYVKLEAIKRELAKLGIHTEEQFLKARAEYIEQGMFDIGCFTSPIPEVTGEISTHLE